MQFPKNIFNNRMLFNMLIMTFLVAGSMTAAFGQRTISTSKDQLASPPKIDQCANGSDVLTPDDCLGANWQNGNLNGNNSSWVEGQFVPYRILFFDLDQGQHSITIEFDATQQGLHAIDYLGTYDKTTDAIGTVNNPCDGHTTCPNAPDQYLIPKDLVAEAGPDGIHGNEDDLVIPDGFFSLFNGTIDSVSGPVQVGTYAGTSTVSYTINFSIAANQTDAVLAWSGHISTRIDWGQDFSAINFNGSPYHMRISGGTGQQDRSMSVDAITYPGSLTIEKQVSYVVNGQIATASSEMFTFSETNFLPDTTFFTLVDDDDPTTNDPPDIISNDNILVFGAENTITITESPVAPWSVNNLSCTIEDGGLGVVGSVSPGPAGNAQNTATIVLLEGNIAKCVYENTRSAVTAALGSITGRVTNSTGIGISGATLTLVNAGTGQTVRAITNPFGYYTFENMEVEELYILSVGHKRYNFLDSQRVFTLDGDLVGIDFTSTW